MNMLYDDVYKYINEVNKIETDNSLVICPSDIYLDAFVNNCSWGIGSQNFFYEIEGDYTGEISTNQLKSLGVEYSLIGHYERRKYFHEDIEDVRKKLEAALEANIMPIVCLGEDKDEDVYEVIDKQLGMLLRNISHIEFITFAYEPNWVIEKKHDYDIEELEKVINYMYKHLEDKYKVSPRIIYGGNVNKENVKKILKIDKLCGILVGSSSIDISLVSEVISSIL